MVENAFKQLDPDRVVGVISGGMDSTTLAYSLVEDYRGVDLISFDYGQRHKVELEYAKRTAVRLGVRHDIVSLEGVGAVLEGSALLNDMEVPEGHYEEETMQSTVVPNRNSIMLNVAAGIAISRGYGNIATGVHAGDHAVYPDCRPEFIQALGDLLHVATDQDIHVHAPFVHKTKADIVTLGHRLEVPWYETWSCYKGDVDQTAHGKHCGRCSTCIERIEAFSIAGIMDPTTYADASLYIELKGQGKVQ